MKTHAIIEFEEGSVTLTIGAAAGGNARIFSCERLPLVDINAETLRATLSSLGSDPMRGAAGVHVIIGDRRACHFAAAVPRMAVADMVGFLKREALRLSSMSQSSEVLLAPRMLRAAWDGRFEVAVSALPQSVVQRMDQACRAVGLDVLGVHTSEACMALAAPIDAASSAVLELNGGRARYVYCQRGVPVKVRRFLLGGRGGTEESLALAAQLAIEVPRTKSWLTESGHDEPSMLVLGRRFPFDDESMELLAGIANDIEFPELDWDLDEIDTTPGLATLMLMEQLFAGQRVPALEREPHLDVPWPRRRVAAVAAVAAAGLAVFAYGVNDGRELIATTAELDRAAVERTRLENELIQVQAAAAPDGETAAAGTIDLALSMRRPVSRMFAEVSNLAPANVHIGSIQFASAAPVTITGIVEGDSRQEALALLAQFVDALHALPYLHDLGKDEVEEVVGHPERVQFRVQIAWRHS